MKQNQNIVITGCSTGIGYATAKVLKQNGYNVIATARKNEDVNRLISEGFTCFKLDITDEQNVEDTLNQIVDITSGKIDVLFNNAGYGQPGALEDVSVEALKEQFETNVFGTHRMTSKMIKIMRGNGGGKIINHSSVLGLISLKFRGAYNASKYAIEGLDDTYRLELSDTNIKIITLNTGPVTSDFRKNALIKFRENIDIEKSHFNKFYKKELNNRLTSDENNAPFNLTSDEAALIVKKIIETKNPKPRYFITHATTILSLLKRVLSTNLLDKILNKI